MEALDNRYDPCAWGSHLPALMGCLAATIGPVLELGVGHFSTPALHAYCCTARRMLFSVEDNPEWGEQFSSRYSSSGHCFIQGKYSEVIPQLTAQCWSVVLIDHSPGGARRAEDFLALRTVSNFLVVHDYHGDTAQAFDDTIRGCPFSHICKTYPPPTLVASDWRKIPEAILVL